MTSSTVGTIGAAFQDEGFAPNLECTYQDTSLRRETTQAYLEAVDWTDPAQVGRFLRSAERLLHGWEPRYLGKFWQSLRRDGYDVEEATGQIRTLGPALAIDSLAKVTDPSAIREQMDRIRRAANDNPALAIGTAKELIESTAKVVLFELGHHVDERADLPELARAGQSWPELARAAQLALGLHPSAGAGSWPDTSEGIKRILGAVTTIANGLAELRNRGHGTGHGPATARVGLRPRHAHLAVNAAITWCQLMLDTLTDPDAPWRRQPPAPASTAAELTARGQPSPAAGRAAAAPAW